MQLSEVIARARRYHEEVTGMKGQVIQLKIQEAKYHLCKALCQVIEGHVPPETYEAKLEAAGVPSEKPDVKQFLDNMTYDRWDCHL